MRLLEYVLRLAGFVVVTAEEHRRLSEQAGKMDALERDVDKLIEEALASQVNWWVGKWDVN